MHSQWPCCTAGRPVNNRMAVQTIQNTTYNTEKHSYIEPSHHTIPYNYKCYSEFLMIFNLGRFGFAVSHFSYHISSFYVHIKHNYTFVLDLFSATNKQQMFISYIDRNGNINANVSAHWSVCGHEEEYWNGKSSTTFQSIRTARLVTKYPFIIVLDIEWILPFSFIDV